MQIKPEVLRGWGPGGWIFFQPETNWWAPLPMSNTFDQQCDNIIAMRKQNPRFNLPIDKPTVAADLEAFTIARWSKKWSRNGMQRFLAGGEEDKKKELSSTRPALKALNAVAARVAGVNLAPIEDWLGEGGVPVDAATAKRRAAVCAACPMNRLGDWRDLLTLKAAQTIGAYLSRKHQMKLETLHDKELGLCIVCKCSNELKVWCPSQFIVENETEEDKSALLKANPNCWVVAEK